MTIEEMSAPPVSTVSPEAAMPTEEVAQAKESIPATPAPVAAAPNPAPVVAPTPQATAPNDDVAQMREQIQALRSQLRTSDIRSTLAERRLVPQDNDLVLGMIEKKLDEGMTADKACAALYKSHPYLFKAPVAQPKTGPSDEELNAMKSLNDAYVKGVIGRLKRDVISFGGTNNG